jgi:phosphoesterase RecJ-like protein
LLIVTFVFRKQTLIKKIIILKSILSNFTNNAKTEIDKAQNIVILSHKNPDGDALGSGLALYNLFTNINKKATFIVPNQLPVYLNWMSGFNDIIVFENNKTKGQEIIKSADLIIMVDFNHRSRLSLVADSILPHKCPKILIDHHPDPENIADFIYSRVSSSSTAEMVYEFIDSAFGKQNINKTIAECLFTGIVTDTGTFSYNSSNRITFKIAGELLAFGINKDYIIDKIYNNYSEYRLRLLGHAINSKMKVFHEYGTAYIYLSKKDMDNYRFESGDTEGFVNFPLSIKGIVFSAIFIEKDNYTKCSFRSKGNFPANIVAKEHFNGGGHKNAAGGEYKASLQKTIEKFESILPEYKNYKL